MSLKITEFTFLEYFAPRYNIPCPRHISGEAKLATIKKTIESWGGKAIVKPDVLIGKRGRAGVVSIVENIHDTVKEIKRISSTEVNGKMPRIAYLEEVINADLEMYTAITYNSHYLSPSLTVSLEGGVDIEEVNDGKKATIPIDVYDGLDAYQASDVLEKLKCPKNLVSILSRTLVDFWDLFISSGFESAEINPWRINDGEPFACDFKGLIDESNYKSKMPEIVMPEYPEDLSDFEEEMNEWSASSHQGQAHVSDLNGKKILPILFGGGVSAIVTETLMLSEGDPMFLSDFGGNPPYERMRHTAEICFKHKLKDAKLLLILGGKANNTMIDITFQAIADALINYIEENEPINIPVVIGRGGPRLIKGLLAMEQALEYLKLPYIIFGPDTPVTLVAEYASKLVKEASNES